MGRCKKSSLHCFRKAGLHRENANSPHLFETLPAILSSTANAKIVRQGTLTSAALRLTYFVPSTSALGLHLGLYEERTLNLKQLQSAPSRVVIPHRLLPSHDIIRDKENILIGSVFRNIIDVFSSQLKRDAGLDRQISSFLNRILSSLGRDGHPQKPDTSPRPQVDSLTDRPTDRPKERSS